jgi:hypothetical protein
VFNNELLIGFDVREQWQSPAIAWDRERRRRFLFREDCPRPLSVDTAVWGSIFDTNEHLERPSWTGPVQFLWDDVERLQAFLSAEWADAWQPCSLMAVTLVPESCTSDELETWTERACGIKTPMMALPAQHMGYDIADRYLLSGLSNCGFLANEDADREKQLWSPALSELHLFEDLDHALAFQEFAALRTQEHAPFFVFSLKMIYR